MTLIPKNIEQIRREGLANAQAKLKEQANYQSKVDALSKHNVGGYYDLRAIAKSKQFKEQSNFYNTDQALAEFEDMLTQSRLIRHKSKYLDYLKKIDNFLKIIQEIFLHNIHLFYLTSWKLGTQLLEQ